MFRLFVVVLAVVGLVSLFSGALGAVGTGIGLFVLLPILLFKLFIILMIFGFIGRRVLGRDRRPQSWRSHRRPGTEEPAPSRGDRFEEWHRMAHAKEEVDSWVDGMPGDPQQ